MKVHTRQVLFTLFALVFLVLAAAVDAAAKPMIEVAPAWRPVTQLTTIDAGLVPGVDDYPNWDLGDDYRYIDLDVYVTATVEYWAAEVACTIDPTILDQYEWDEFGGLTGDFGDDRPMVTWGSDWGGLGGDFTGVVTYEPVKGTLTATAAKFGYGGSWPMGRSGSPVTELMATLRFRVKPQAGVFKKAVKLSCKADFLDMDGKTVVKPKILKTDSLTVLSGYNISGIVTYQAAPKSPTGIAVECIYDPFGVPEVQPMVFTNNKGEFLVPNLRKFGTYSCDYYGSVIDPALSEDLHLTGQSVFDIFESSVNLLPIPLLSGNVERVFSPFAIDDNDLFEITGPGKWETSVPAAFSGGDANGDKKVNRSDLAIVAGNYTWSEPAPSDHWLYSVPPWEGTIYTSIQWSKPTAAQVGKSKSPEYWPTLSPDGMQIAFVRQEKSGEYALYVEDLKGKATRLTPKKDWPYSAFAPSWSPDGTQIAFVCSQEWRDQGNSYYQWQNPRDGGRLCVVDVNGSSLRFVPNSWSAEIFPPAWLNNNQLAFATNEYAGDTIRWADITTDWNGASGEFVGAPNFSMPSVLWDTLFYVNPANGNLYQDQIITWPNGAGTDMELAGAPALVYDPELDPNTGAPGMWVDWYTVRYNAPSVIATQYHQTDGWGGGQFIFVNHNGADWDPGYSFTVLGQSGNPWWDGNLDNYTELFAVRNTLDWVP